MDAERDSELQAFQAAVRGGVTRVWPSPTTASQVSTVRQIYDLAVAQGWTALAAEGTVDAALVVQSTLGELACPAPIMDAFVAATALRAAGEVTWAEQIEAGELVAAVVTRQADGGPPIGVEAADVLTHLLVLPSGSGAIELCKVGAVTTTPGLALPAWSTVEPAEPVLRLAVDDEIVEDARCLVRLGLATRAVAAARQSHLLATEHAKTRVQFGRTVGSFQHVQKRAVDGLIDLTLFELLRAEAVRLHGGDDPSWRLAGELAVTHAASAAPRVQLGAHHTLAAVGYFEEHEAPWLFRRVHADLARLVAFPLAAGEVADFLLESLADLSSPALRPESAAFRREVRTFLRSALIDVSEATAADDRTFVAALADRGYVRVAWPREWGGRESTIEEQAVLGEELAYHRAPGARERAAADIVGNALLRFGSSAQQAAYLPLIGAAQFPFYLGYSEPESGSDLASLRTTALPDGDGWVVNGAKLWGTGAHDAQYVWLAARTDPHASPPHAGISVFLFRTDVEGWSKSEHRALSGEISCSTFFDDVRIGADALVGELNDGWRVLRSALTDERIVMAASTAGVRRQFDDLVAGLRNHPELAGPRGSAARHLLSELAVRLQGARLLVRASMAAGHASEDAARRHASMAKIVAGELAEDFGEATLALLGPAAALSTGATIGGGHFEAGLRHSIVLVVGGGTADIQRNLMARSMGLGR
jgi:alkylation response protein AidB-like acyl-CoA dehydrogenase